MKGILPEKGRLRHDKLGFPTPEAEWLRVGRYHIQDLFSDGNARCIPYLRPCLILERLDALLQQDTAFSPVWPWVALEVWLRTFFD